MYLKENVRLEPLVDSWYAWPLLISPATAAMFAANHHLRIMESFVDQPEFHRAAAQNPAMRGGPFMDYHGDVARVREHISSIKSKLAHVLQLAAAIKAFDTELRKEARGGSLADYYAKVPAELKGFVELCYDMHNTPTLRFIEGLLYRSKYYDPARQSIAVCEVKDDSRPFVLSTPRLHTDHELLLKLPFHSRAIDTLMAMRTSPGSHAFIEQLIEEHLDGASAGKDSLRALFVESPPRAVAERTYRGERIRVRYFGHATVLLETDGISILTDPAISYPVANGIPRYTFRDLPERIDYVLLTHSHQDHVMLETLLQLRTKVGSWIVPRNATGMLQDPSLKLMLRTLGFANVVELDEMESIDVPHGAITGIPFLGEHGDLYITSKLAFHVRLKGTAFLFVADSNNLEPELYSHVHRCIGDVDHLFIGMECDGAPMSWLYGPLATQRVDRRLDQTRRLNGSTFPKALALMERMKPKSAHVYAMGQEPWLQHISSIVYHASSTPIVESDRFVAACRERGVASERLFGAKSWLM